LAHEEAEGKERRDALSKRLARAAEVLTRQFPQITRVAVMGTFLSPAFARVDSEVDVFVSGLPKSQYFGAFFLLELELQVPFFLSL
jgi:predicted nucleotidyltransferase